MIPIAIQSDVARFEGKDRQTGEMGPIAEIDVLAQTYRELDATHPIAVRFLRFLTETVEAWGQMKVDLADAEIAAEEAAKATGQEAPDDSDGSRT